jgi:hypothetical protein
MTLAQYWQCGEASDGHNAKGTIGFGCAVPTPSYGAVSVFGVTASLDAPRHGVVRVRSSSAGTAPHSVRCGAWKGKRPADIPGINVLGKLFWRQRVVRAAPDELVIGPLEVLQEIRLVRAEHVPSRKMASLVRVLTDGERRGGNVFRTVDHTRHWLKRVPSTARRSLVAVAPKGLPTQRSAPALTMSGMKSTRLGRLQFVSRRETHAQTLRCV